MKKGKLVILSTNSMIDVFTSGEEVEKALSDEDWSLHSSLFVETFSLFDSRLSQSKVNKLFAYKVYKALKGGSNIFIVVPDSKAVDKRLRENAIILEIPK